MLIEFPQQDGKCIKETRNTRTLAKATFDERDKTYYYQGAEGYFSVHFKGIKKIDKEQFSPVFRELRGDRVSQLVVAEFQARKGGARVELTVKAITAKKFKKATLKIENDISTISIQGEK